MDNLFDISVKDDETVIRSDRLSSDTVKQSDIAFYLDQKAERKMVYSTEDIKYSLKVAEALKRSTEMQASSSRETSHDVSLPLFGSDSTSSASTMELSGDESDYEPGGSHAKGKQSNSVAMCIPKNILYMTTAAELRLNLSHQQHVGIISSVIAASGGDLQDFSITYKTSLRARKGATEDLAREIRQSFVDEVVKTRSLLYVHFDGKLMPELQNLYKPKVHRAKEERFAIILTSPDREREQLLGIPALPSGTGRSQMEKLLEVFDDWEICDLICRCIYDTASVNSDHLAGTVALLEKALGRKVMRLPCRRHIFEVLSTHATKKIMAREVKNPVDKIFQAFRDKWDKVRDPIDYEHLNKFDWTRVYGTDVESHAYSARNWAMMAVATGVFARGDYKLLAGM